MNETHRIQKFQYINKSLRAMLRVFQGHENALKLFPSRHVCYVSGTHSFQWHVQNASIPCRSQELLPIPLCYVRFPATLLHQLLFHPLSPHLATYFLVYLSILLFPNSYIIPFWEFYFLPFSVHVQTNYLTLSPL